MSRFYQAVEFADYYCALPAISFALNGAFYTNPILVEATFLQPHFLIETAVKLRNAVLYRECLIQTMDPWNLPQYTAIEDESLQKVAAAAYEQLGSMILDAQYRIVNRTSTLMAYHAQLVGKQLLRAWCFKNQGPFQCPANPETLMDSKSYLISSTTDTANLQGLSRV